MANHPVQQFRVGRIRASIWANQTDQGVKHNVTFTRLYKTGRRWQDTGTFDRDDLPLIGEVAELARQWILRQSIP